MSAPHPPDDQPPYLTVLFLADGEEEVHEFKSREAASRLMRQALAHRSDVVAAGVLEPVEVTTNN